MSTRAKFVVLEKSELHGQGFKIKLNAVTTGSDEDKEFFKWTPSGEISLVTVSERAAENFIVGSFYYVDFEEVPRVY